MLGWSAALRRDCCDLDVFSPQSIGLVVSGADLPVGRAFVAHVLQQRSQVLRERGARLPILALHTTDGLAVAPVHKENYEDVLRPSVDAPHGGLSAADLGGTFVAAGSLEDVLEHSACAAFVLVDYAGTARAELARSRFSAAWFGASIMTVGGSGDGHACEADASGWIESWHRPEGVTPAIVLDAILDGWRGWAAPLVATESPCFSSCLVCATPADGDVPLVCEACHAVCFCRCHSESSPPATAHRPTVPSKNPTSHHPKWRLPRILRNATAHSRGLRLAGALSRALTACGAVASCAVAVSNAREPSCSARAACHTRRRARRSPAMRVVT